MKKRRSEGREKCQEPLLAPMHGLDSKHGALDTYRVGGCGLHYAHRATTALPSPLEGRLNGLPLRVSVDPDARRVRHAGQAGVARHKVDWVDLSHKKTR